MKKSNLNEVKRMQQLAGIITESLSSQDIDKVIKIHGYKVKDMKSLKDEMEYTDLIDTVAEEIEGSATGKASKDSYSKARQALLQYGKEKFNSMEESQVNERYPSQVWDWDITEFGEYNPPTNTFMIFMDNDGFADYMDTEFDGWLDDEDIAEEGTNKFREDIKNAVEEEYGPNVRIVGDQFN